MGEGLVYIYYLLIQDRNHITLMDIFCLLSAEMAGKFAIFLVFLLVGHKGTAHFLHSLEKLLNLCKKSIMVIFFVQLYLKDGEDLLVLFLVVVDDGRIAPLFSLLFKGLFSIVDMTRESMRRDEQFLVLVHAIILNRQQFFFCLFLSTVLHLHEQLLNNLIFLLYLPLQQFNSITQYCIFRFLGICLFLGLNPCLLFFAKLLVNLSLLTIVLISFRLKIETVMLLSFLYSLIFRFALSQAVPGSIIVNIISTILVFCHLLLPYLIGDQRKCISFMRITVLLSIKMRFNAFPPEYWLLLRVISIGVVPEVDVNILITCASINGIVDVCHFERRGAWQDSIEVVGVTLMLNGLGLHEIRLEYILIIYKPKLSNNSST